MPDPVGPVLDSVDSVDSVDPFDSVDSVELVFDSVPDPVDSVLEPVDSVDPVEPVFEHISARRPSDLMHLLVICHAPLALAIILKVLAFSGQDSTLSSANDIFPHSGSFKNFKTQLRNSLTSHDLSEAEPC